MYAWLSDEEITDLCDGKTQARACISRLKALGLTVTVKKGSGKPVVLRSNVEAVFGGMPTKTVQSQSTGPDRAALIAHIGGRHGKKAQV